MYKISYLKKVEEEISLKKYTGIKVKEIRNKKKFTQENLSELTGLSRVSIVNIESGKHSLTLKTLEMFCESLDCKSSDILPF